MLEEKEKTMGWEGGFTDKTVWTCLYACYLCTKFFFACFVFWLFLVKNFYIFFRMYNCACKFDRNKIKIYLKKYIYHTKQYQTFNRKIKCDLLNFGGVQNG